MIKSVHHKYGTMIDPPSGWKYGFPKHLPEGKDYKELLRENNCTLFVKSLSGNRRMFNKGQKS